MIIRPNHTPDYFAKQMEFMSNPNLCTDKVLKTIVEIVRRRDAILHQGLTDDQIIMKLAKCEMLFWDLWLIIDQKDDLPKELLELIPAHEAVAEI